MSLADYAAYRDRIAAPFQAIHVVNNSVATSLGGAWYSHWRSGPNVGLIPSTAAVPGRTNSGAIGQNNAAGAQRLARFIGKSQNPTTVVIADRLAHQGGLSGTVTTPQTTNLPTAALTRYATGAGVWAALEIYTAIGVTATTVTASYTNQDGTAGRTTQPVVLGATDNREAQRLIPLSLQAGDSGVRAVASVTVLATTGTAGNFGVTLFRPIMAFHLPAGFAEQNVYDAVLQMGGFAAEIQPEACLWFCAIGQTSSSGTFAARMDFIEE